MLLGLLASIAEHVIQTAQTSYKNPAKRERFCKSACMIGQPVGNGEPLTHPTNPNLTPFHGTWLQRNLLVFAVVGGAVELNKLKQRPGVIKQAARCVHDILVL